MASTYQYFYKLFTFGNATTTNTYTLYVEDANIVYDFILSIYNQKSNIGEYSKEIHLLKTIKYKLSLCIEVDVKLLYDLKIPNCYYDLLLEIMDSFDYTNNYKLMQVIRKNLPIDYDIDKNFNPEFIKELNKKSL